MGRPCTSMDIHGYLHGLPRAGGTGRPSRGHGRPEYIKAFLIKESKAYKPGLANNERVLETNNTKEKGT